MFGIFDKTAAPKKMTSIKFGCATQYFAKRQSDGYYDLYRRYRKRTWDGDVTVVEVLEEGFTQDAVLKKIEELETAGLKKAFDNGRHKASTKQQEGVLKERQNTLYEKRRRKTRHHWTKKIVKVGN